MLRFGTFEVDLQTQQIRKSGLRVPLQSKPFQLLLILLEHPDEVVTREDLYRALWVGENFGEFDRKLNNAINRLRRSLNDSAAVPRYIETVPRIGYRFIAPVERQSFEPSAPSLDPAPGARFGPVHRRPFSVAATAALILATLILVGNINFEDRSQDASRAPAARGTSENRRESEELYLKGRYFWNKRNKADLELATTYFQRAIENDPESALAYSGLADSYSIMGMMVSNPRDFYSKAESAALKSVSLGRNSGEAHASLALVHYCNFRFADAASEFHRAIVLKPDYASAHQWYGLYLRGIGQTTESIRELELAHHLDPFSPQISFALANAYRKAGRNNAAEALFLEILNLDSDFRRVNAGLALLYGAQHRLSDSLATRLTASLQDEFPDVSEYVAVGLFIAGKREAAIDLKNQLVQRAEPADGSSPAIGSTPPPACFPFMLAAMGQRQQSIQCLISGYKEQAAYMAQIKTDPITKELQSDPKFQNLLVNAGFPPAIPRPLP